MEKYTSLCAVCNFSMIRTLSYGFKTDSESELWF